MNDNTTNTVTLPREHIEKALVLIALLKNEFGVNGNDIIETENNLLKALGR